MKEEPVIEIQGLRHTYKKHVALDSVSLDITRGAIHGFVGPNGAGKTTTLKILATLMRPQHGVVKVFGLNITSHYKEVRRRIGFMPDHFSMYRQMTVFEYLDFFAAAYGLDFSERTKTVKDVLALTDMHSRRDDLIKGLSRGMQQRVSLARVLVHDPELLLLDEPASGLDPRARIELMEILRELQRMGKTIFISSHILSELAILCDSVTILDRGQLKYCGPMDGLTRRSHDSADYLITLADASAAIEETLKKHPGLLDVTATGGQYRLRLQQDQVTLNDVLRLILDGGAQVLSAQRDTRHLNEAFMDLTSPGVPPPLPERKSP
jgi:ABC-2 type transport system ATP-binding protein